MKNWPALMSIAVGAIGVVVAACCVFDVTPLAGAMAGMAARFVADIRLIAAASVALVVGVLVVEVGRRRRAPRESRG